MKTGIGIAFICALVLATLMPTGVRSAGYTCSSETETHVLAFDMELEDSTVRHLSIETDAKPAYTDCLLLVIEGENAFSQQVSSSIITLTSTEDPGCRIILTPLLDAYDVIIDSHCKSYYCSRNAYMPSRFRVYEEDRPCEERRSPSP